MGITVSITIPEKLEKLLSEKADSLDISRSRFVSNLLLEWQQNNTTEISCANKIDGCCIVSSFGSHVSDDEAKKCVEYRRK